ncbi:cupin-like domain-containing protein [Candidatus Methylospira mobilis]|uniref:Cupin-like domain-containing protein n=2 Tax=Candidatus Methylospira mobilis TaxID=1808979 RepID=A0A5Q0BMN6_9GAMM|nr:cupin-like domain-containing protein [Candidatus Methylospira mobilis]
MELAPETSLTRKTYPSIERRATLSFGEFAAGYVAQQRPVVVTGALARCPAVSRWNFDYLRRVSGKRIVTLKQGLTDSGVSGLGTVKSTLHDYLDRLEACASGTGSEKPPYLHDVPLLSVIADAADDLDGFPAGYFPDWYRPCWLQFAQFFLGPSRSLTPLHFDCLLTHNLFFQVSGRKRFILLTHDQLPLSYRYRWRWCAVDAENPDFSRHPLYRDALVQECTVAPGDMLYMPPGMLHHVRSLDNALSFNVDWHTRDSALRGVLALAQGMPLKNVYYNAVIALALHAGISAERILPWYRSYLNYVS